MKTIKDNNKEELEHTTKELNNLLKEREVNLQTINTIDERLKSHEVDLNEKNKNLNDLNNYKTQMEEKTTGEQNEEH